MFYIIIETKTEPTTRVYPYHIHTMIAFLCPKCRWKLFDLVVRTMTIADKTSRKKIYSWRVFSVVFEKKALGIRFRQSCAGRKKNTQRNYTRMEANEERSKNVSCLRLLQYLEIVLSLFFIFVLPFLRVSLPWPSFSYLLINFDCQYRFLLSVTHKRFFFPVRRLSMAHLCLGSFGSHGNANEGDGRKRRRQKNNDIDRIKALFGGKTVRVVRVC